MGWTIWIEGEFFISIFVCVYLSILAMNVAGRKPCKILTYSCECGTHLPHYSLFILKYVNWTYDDIPTQLSRLLRCEKWVTRKHPIKFHNLHESLRLKHFDINGNWIISKVIFPSCQCTDKLISINLILSVLCGVTTRNLSTKIFLLCIFHISISLIFTGDNLMGSG